MPAEVRDDLEVIFAEDMREVLAAALEPLEAVLEGAPSGATQGAPAVASV